MKYVYMVGTEYVAIDQEKFILVDSILKATQFISKNLKGLLSKVFESEIKLFGVKIRR